MIRNAALFILILVLLYAAMFGAWLGGANPGPWTHAIAWFFAALLTAAIIIHEKNP